MSDYNELILEAQSEYLGYGGLLALLELVCMWKIYVKAGKPGWACLVPFYNVYVYFQITFGNGWLFLLLLIPIVNIVILIMAVVKLGKAFGKGGGFICGLLFLSFIFLPILAFSNAKYIGPNKK